ncbi:uncharacterized protein LOC131059738 [Cryptomeria japonica]|uniref:uncharacterized protein LOC131059738 n=1 Tax=Cryptomeria japonica TaxID=3369 RepID=UPI0027DA3520|nr:uncharacterized protein LOC131059738 [Cryptomeria japonica]
MSGYPAGPMRAKGPKKGARTKTAGWATFDLQQRLKEGEFDSIGVDPFPPLIPNSSSNPNYRGLTVGTDVRDKQMNADITAVCSKDINFMSARSPDIVKSSVSEPDNMIGLYQSTSLPGTNVQSRIVTDQVNQNQLVVEKLKGLHPWADKGLIEDVLVAAGYDHEQASASLDSMSATDSSELSDLCEALENATTKEGPVNCDATSNCLGSEEAEEAEGNRLMGLMLVAPPEPEWDGNDDLYWKNRKDGLRLSRSAGRHSKNAQNAYLRGDYHTARILSNKSQQEYLAAEQFNAKAAAEILRIGNENNNVWKLDLHGLHALEAVDALASRLEMIEYNVPKSISLSSGRMREQGNCHTDKHAPEVLVPSMSRPSELEVITGLGIHSRGGAALPIAIKNFLIDRGYKFSEARAGVLGVRPKFRYS